MSPAASRQAMMACAGEVFCDRMAVVVAKLVILNQTQLADFWEEILDPAARNAWRFLFDGACWK
jgi:hypothetical protein